MCIQLFNVFHNITKNVNGTKNFNAVKYFSYLYSFYVKLFNSNILYNTHYYLVGNH